MLLIQTIVNQRYIRDKHGVVIKGLQEQGVKVLNTKELKREPGNQLQNLNNDNAKGRRIN